MSTATMTTLEACRRRKRKHPSVFEFTEFGRVDSVINLIGPFRDNIRLFLEEYGEVIEDYSVYGFQTWSISLSSHFNDVVFPLYVIEEPIQHSLTPFCIHCRCIGWSNHFVCKRRYHFIIPAGSKWNKPLKGNCLMLRTHLLHGMIHCNGFGHLLCINSLQDSSRFLGGNDLMDLWDRLCTSLQTRKVSVCDLSTKKSMELRLIHGVAYGMSWFGKWGYKFGRGSFGVTEEKYERALQYLESLGLDKIINDFKNTDQGRKIEQIVRFYRGASETQLISIGDLLQFMLALKSNSLKGSRKTVICSRNILKDEQQIIENVMTIEEFVCALVNADCRWSQKRLKHTLIVIVGILRYNEVMSRQELRDQARHCIGDTGLIDFLLKSISSFVVDNQIVHKVINPMTKIAEYKIKDVLVDDTTKSGKHFATNLECRWPEQRVEQTAQVVVKILKEKQAMKNGNGAMSRQELRDAARQCVGDTGLIDFVLKSINNFVIGSQIVSRVKNPLTRLIEFAIRDDNGKITAALEMSSLDVDSVYDDVVFLYKNVLLGYPEWHTVSLASQVILDSKHLVKEWVFNGKDDKYNQLMTLTCRVLPSFDELETELTRPLPPGEIVMVPPWMTIGELKQVVQCALRDTYCIMERFVVSQIGGLKGLDEEMLLMYAVGSGGDVWVRGCGLDLDTKMRYESGAEDGRVDCDCGAKVDDGERMVACDACLVWLHTRCCGIDDDYGDEILPSSFLCANCTER